ncbi:hypothetical protein OHA72_61225 [Dactylosporangium sp. NBC_01737]|uniref:hypothetical protein n=1 Tax=Dactylosporangium sp. NBC_01737 TaxID=2975959 RepID=UPI002E0E63A1|nr:hypothetical protein OHA72_61225 [Dactylosporangium sp. NBC_01737]
MKSRTPIAVTALLALALAGCADGTTDTTAGAGGTPSSSAAAPASTAASASASSAASQNVGDTLLVFTRTGGLAGTNDRLVVRPDGSWTLTTKSGSKEGKLTAAELTALKSTLEQVGFSKLPKVNSNGNVADGYKYSISYGGDEVVAEDGAVPTALQPVITTLNGLLSK